MGKITVETCEIEGLKVITPTVFGDERGYFMETYNYNDYKAAGIDMEFVQDNQSSSKKGVLRGLHFQINYPQDKLVRVVSGEVFDVAVDLRPGSETYGKWFGVVLSAENKKQLFRYSRISSRSIACMFSSVTASSRSLIASASINGCSTKLRSIRAPMAVFVLSSTHKREPRFCFSRRVSTSSRFLLEELSITI